MRHAISKTLAVAIATAPLLIACGGGKSDNPGPINTPQCSGASCGTQGAPAIGAGPAPLCPANADIGANTYLGGAGSGEIVSINIDAVNMKYTLKWLESPIPLVAGTVTPTRAGTTVTGAVAHLPQGSLPTDEQTRCAFVLTPGAGAASDGSAYTTYFNPQNPPIVFVGNGVAGGGIPGGKISFPGVDIVVAKEFAVAARSFDFYPFIGFSSVSTNVADLAGNYTSLLYHLVPSDKFKAAGLTSLESYDATGRCTALPGQAFTTCQTAQNPWLGDSKGSYFTSANAPQIEAPRKSDDGLLGPFSIVASAHMVLGKLNGQIVPVVVRTGQVNPVLTSPQVDDESGIAMLAPIKPIASGDINGGYVGADSNFKYTATLLQNQVGSFLNPMTQQAETGFGMNYTASNVPGLVVAQTQDGSLGRLIAVGGLYAMFVGGAVNGGPTPSSVNGDTLASPYFGIGAQISK